MAEAYRRQGDFIGGQRYSGLGERRAIQRAPKGYRRSDERICEILCERLIHATHVDPSEVSVDVSGAKVTLEGSVPDRRMKHAIEDIAADCYGITDVVNRIRVSQTSSHREST